jgi:BlaI family transcriptional regulator, penicillinase repressor
MKQLQTPNPTAAELEILRVLWDRGDSTVREVHEVLNAARPTGYTTVLKLMQIMTAKGLLKRNEDQRAHVYEASLAAEQTKRRLVGDLLERAFGGSASELMMHALSRRGSAEEIAEIRRMLDEFEQTGAVEGGRR